MALSPILARSTLRTDQFFSQGFLQVEVPLNDSRITSSDRQLFGAFTAVPTAGSLTHHFLSIATSASSPFCMWIWVRVIGFTATPATAALTGVHPTIEVHTPAL